MMTGESSFRILLVLLLSALTINVSGFVNVVPTTSFLLQGQPSVTVRYAKESNKNTNNNKASSPSPADKSISALDPLTLFPEAPQPVEVKDVVLLPHRPLGLTVEESLADHRFVFITKITEGGYAQAAGLQVGDTLLQVTGVFGDLSPVVGVGVEKIKGMVSSRPEEEPLELQVARGTNVFDDHEKAVIELCSNDSSDKEVEQCVIDYLSMDNIEQAARNAPSKGTKGDDEECDIEDDDADCMVGDLLNMWAEDLPPIPPPSNDLGATEAPTEKVKPWSSRSSPSGTFVRDPVTGEMKNIDA